MIGNRGLGWWYWLATSLLLTAGVAGWAPGFALAIAFCAWQAVHFALRRAGFSVQVRVVYLAFLVLAWPPPLRPLYWLPLVGTWANVLFDYCFLARTLSLLPWNREGPLTAGLVRRTYLSPPVRGSVRGRFEERAGAGG